MHCCMQRIYECLAHNQGSINTSYQGVDLNIYNAFPTKGFPSLMIFCPHWELVFVTTYPFSPSKESCFHFSSIYLLSPRTEGPYLPPPLPVWCPLLFMTS